MGQEAEFGGLVFRSRGGVLQERRSSQGTEVGDLIAEDAASLEGILLSRRTLERFSYAPLQPGA